MGNEWKEHRLKDLTLKITKGSTPTVADGGFLTKGINFIKAECVTKEGKIDETKFAFISDEVHMRFKRSQLESGDLLFSMAGVVLGKTAVVQQRHLPANINQALALIRPNLGFINPEFLHYFLQQKSIFHFVNNSTAQSAQPNINLEEIGKLSIKLPPLHIQKSIAHILGSLDDKIELNRRMNQTLEQMAQALFKSWFVDFDPVIDNALAAGNPIPDELQERAQARQALGNNRKPLPAHVQQLFPSEFEFSEALEKWVPRGWRVKSVTDMVWSVSETYPLKKVDSVIFLNTGDIQEGKFLHSNYSDTVGLPGQAKKSIKEGDILFSEIRPENKRFAFVSFDSSDYVVSTKLMVLRSTGTINSLFVYFFLKQQENIDFLQLMAETRSGTFPQITFDNLKDIKIAVPEDIETIDYFTANYLSPVFGKIIQNENTISMTTGLRDTLLPKLITGELRLPEAEKLIKGCVS